MGLTEEEREIERSWKDGYRKGFSDASKKFKEVIKNIRKKK